MDNIFGVPLTTHSTLYIPVHYILHTFHTNAARGHAYYKNGARRTEFFSYIFLYTRHRRTGHIIIIIIVIIIACSSSSTIPCAAPSSPSVATSVYIYNGFRPEKHAARYISRYCPLQRRQ